jgi:hypothetical protein
MRHPKLLTTLGAILCVLAIAEAAASTLEPLPPVTPPPVTPPRATPPPATPGTYQAADVLKLTGNAKAVGRDHTLQNKLWQPSLIRLMLALFTTHLLFAHLAHTP